MAKNFLSKPKSSRQQMTRASLFAGTILVLVIACALADIPAPGGCDSNGPIARCTDLTGWTFNGNSLVKCCFTGTCTTGGQTWTATLKKQTRPTYYKDVGSQRQWCFVDSSTGWEFDSCCGVLQPGE